MTTRRTFLRAAGVGMLALGGCAGNGGKDEWIAVDSPVQQELYDVVMTQEGPYAIGGGGYVVTRRNGEWTVAVDKGPTGAQNTLRAAAASDNGRHLWFAGDSGVVGVYDVADRSMTSHSAPQGLTSTWEALSVVGLADAESVYFANGSGQVVRAAHTDGNIDWQKPVKPGSGSSITSLQFTGRGFGYTTDTSSNVFQTVDGAKSWRRIGIQRGSVNLHDIAPLPSNQIDVVGDSGAVFDYNGFTWTRSDAGENALLAIERDHHRGVVTGDSGGVFQLTTHGWKRQRSSTGETLHGVCLGTTDHPSVAVGEGGTILEHHKS